MQQKPKPKELKASIQITRSGYIGAENALLVPLPPAIMTLLYTLFHSHNFFSLCLSFRGPYPGPLLHVQFEIQHLQLPAFVPHWENIKIYIFTARY